MKKRNNLSLNCLHVVSCRLQQDSYKHHFFLQGEVLGAHKRDNTNFRESSTLEVLQIGQKKETNKTKWSGKYQLPVGKRSEPRHFFSSVLKHCERQCNSTTDNFLSFCSETSWTINNGDHEAKCFLPVQRFCIRIFTLSVENNISHYQRHTAPITRSWKSTTQRIERKIEPEKQYPRLKSPLSYHPRFFITIR